MNLEKLTYLIDLVDSSSFTKAAAKNHIAQTSISQQIRSLEDYFGVKFIDRSVTPVAPTPAGRLLYQEALKVSQQYTDFEKKLILKKR